MESSTLHHRRISSQDVQLDAKESARLWLAVPQPAALGPRFLVHLRVHSSDFERCSALSRFSRRWCVLLSLHCDVYDWGNWLIQSGRIVVKGFRFHEVFDY